MTTKININQICKLKIYEKLESDHFYYLKKGKYFWNRKKGFYKKATLGSDYFTTEKQIEMTGILYIEDRKVYYKPHVDIYLSNGHCITDWSESISDLHKFIDEYFKDLPLIIIA